HLDFAIVEVKQRAVLVDGRGADHRVVDLELPNKIDRCLPNHTPVRVPNDTAGDDDLDLLVSLQDVGDVHVVGNDEQAVLAAQSRRHLLGRGANIDQQRGAVGNQGRGLEADASLGVGGKLASRLIAQVGGARGQDGATVKALQDAALAQLVEVLANRLRRDVVAVRH